MGCNTPSSISVSKAITHFETALSEYRGDLLPSCYDEWIEPEREGLQLQMTHALRHLIELLKEEGRYEDAVHYAMILIQRDDLSESAHFALIELLALDGDRTAALAAYYTCAEILDKELGVEPGSALQALKDRIANGKFMSSAAPSPEPRKQPVQGVQDTPPVPVSGAKTTIRPLRRWLAVAFLCLVAVATVLWQQFGTGHGSSIGTDKSIAVLPFENRSSLEDDRFFTDGIHDDLISQIARIHGLRTISRTSVMAYRDSDKSLKEIARELGVNAIIEGGVQRAGEQIRINIQLVDVASNSYLWAENFTQKLTASNLFDIQSKISSTVAEKLRIALLAREASPDTYGSTENLAALEAYYHGTTAEDRADSIQHFETAVRLDPNFALAHARLALAYLSQIWWNGKADELQVAKAKPHVFRAIELNPTLSEAYQGLGELRNHQDRTDEAKAAFERAIELNPNNASAYTDYAMFLDSKVGDGAAVARVLQKSLDLDPNRVGGQVVLARILLARGEIEKAQQHLEALAQRKPEDPLVQASLANLYYAYLGRFDDAIVANRAYYTLDPDNRVPAKQLADCYIRLNDVERANFWIERALALTKDPSERVTLRNRLSGLLMSDEEIEPIARETMRIDPRDIQMIWRLGIIEMANGRAQTARLRILNVFPELFREDASVMGSVMGVWRAKDTARVMLAAGDTKQGEYLAEQAMQIVETMELKLETFIMKASLSIVLGREDDALEAARRYFERGGTPFRFEKEVELKALRKYKEYRDMVARANERATTQRERVRTLEAKGQLASLPPIP